MRVASHVTAVLACVVLGDCTESATLPGDALAPVTIGVISSESGSLETLGPHWTNAFLLAVQEVNAAGGVLPGRRVDVVVTDDETNPAVAGQIAHNLVERQGVVGIIGAPGSGASLEVAKVAGPARIPQISGTSTSPLLNAPDAQGNDMHPYFFRTVPGDHLQGWVLGSAARGMFDEGSFTLYCEKVALVHLNDAYGSPFADSIAKRIIELDGSVVTKVPIPEGRPSYQAEVDQLIGSGPDCIAMVLYPDSGGTIVREWHSSGGDPDVRWLGTDGVRGTGFVEAAGEHAVGVVGTAPASDPNRPELLAFNSLYEATFAMTPGTMAEAVYDATALLLLGIARAGTTNGDDVRNALFEVSAYEEAEESFGPGELLRAIEKIREGAPIDYDGAGGNVDLQPATGDVIQDYEIWTWDGTAFVRLVNVTVRTILEGMGEGTE
jgi:ABC-type branched-subunit amino acid transport system substrate-binding protein